MDETGFVSDPIALSLSNGSQASLIETIDTCSDTHQVIVFGINVPELECRLTYCNESHKHQPIINHSGERKLVYSVQRDR